MKDYMESKVGEIAQLAELDRFTDDLQGEDDLGAVVRAHIHIEQWLNQFLRALLVQSQHLKALKLDYDQAVSLALALGLDPAYGKSLRAFGTLRNRFAHRIGMTLDQSTLTNLYESFAGHDRELMQKTIRAINELNAIKPPKKLYELPARTQFMLMASTLWTVVRTEAHMALNNDKPARSHLFEKKSAAEGP